MIRKSSLKKRAAAIAIAVMAVLQTGCSVSDIGGISDIEALKNDILKDIYSDDDGDDSFDDLNTGLYSQISRENEDKSFVFSPYSIKDCITLTYDGMSDDAKAELVSLGMDKYEISGIKKLDDLCRGSKDINIVNRVFYDKKDEDIINRSLIRKDREQGIDMDDPKKASDIINSWADENTHGKISGIVSPDDINADTSMVLCNAIWMKARWKYEKEYKNRENGIIWKSKSTGDTRYKGFYGTPDLKDVKKADGASIVRLPYDVKGLSLSMYVILPDNESPGAADEWMDTYGDDLEDILDFEGNKGPEGYDSASFDIPDFEIRYKSVKMLPMLARMGLDEKFTDTPDLRYGTYRKLSKDPEKGFYVSGLSHAAYIKTDIKGTEAAAVTAEYAESKCAEASTGKGFDVYCDHPFMFVIKDETSGQSLFMGRVDKDALTKL